MRGTFSSATSRRTGRQLRPFEGSYRTPTQWRFTIDLDQSDPYLRLADVTLSAGNSLCLESMYVNRGPRRKFRQQ